MATLIQNVIKKMKSEGFVRYVNNKFLDGQDDEITVNVDGSGSGSNPMWVGYATSAAGANFTVEPTTAQATTYEYIAFKTHPTKPGKNEFANLWFHRKGIQGIPGEKATNGTNGDHAGFRYNYSSDTTETRPGGGVVKFNNANPALATEIYLDYSVVSGLSIASVIELFTEGMTIMLRPNNNTSAAFAVFQVNGAQYPDEEWTTISVENLVMSGTAFAPGDELCLQFFGGSSGGTGTVTEANILLAGNFARFVSNGGGGYDLMDNAGNKIKSVSNVFRLSQFTGIAGVTDLPAASTFPHGAVVRLHESCLVGAGANPLGLMMQADATSGAAKWRAYGRQRLFHKTFGSLAAPTCSLTAAADFAIGATPEIPANLLSSDSRLSFHIKYRKYNATQPTVDMWLGTSLTRNANSKIYTHTITTALLNDNIAKTEVDFLTSTTARSAGKAPTGGTGAASGFLDCTTALNIATKMYFYVNAYNFTTADQVDLLEMAIYWEF